ncbi:MAG: hypothetical protein U1E02_10980, partial [Hydrogenophaga sp.]|nr:hypothetical protein [Hydrogenophaga sp.]
MLANKYILLLFFFVGSNSVIFGVIPQYYCTASDAKYFESVKVLIGSIHRSNFDSLQQIAVFNLGLTKSQIGELKRMAKVSVYEVEKTNPYIIEPIKKYFYKKGRAVPGAYSWKPVVIKQSLDMFPYVLWLDAGCVVLRDIDCLFQYIKKRGYFFLSNGRYLIKQHITHYVCQNFNLDNDSRRWILEKGELWASMMGISRSDTIAYKKFLLPCYDATKDIKNFMNDGTSLDEFSGFEQAIMSIYAHLNGMDLFKRSEEEP